MKDCSRSDFAGPPLSIAGTNRRFAIRGYYTKGTFMRLAGIRVPEWNDDRVHEGGGANFLVLWDARRISIVILFHHLSIQRWAQERGT